MADVKISALPASTTPLAGTEVLPIVQSSTTRQVSVANLTAGRAVSALSIATTTGATFATTSGSVGIGTSSPSYTLDVLNSASATLTTRIKNSNASGLSGILFDNNSSTAGASVAFNSSTNLFEFWTNSDNGFRWGYAGSSSSFTERMRLDASGNLGIGTTSQNERLRLNSSTAAQARMSISYQDSTISFYGSYSGITGTGNATDVFLSSANVLAFGSGGTTERMRIDASGNVGIGTSSPTSFGGFKTLELANSSGNAISLVTGTSVIAQTIASNTNSLVYTGSRSNHSLVFTTNDTERMRLDTSGNLLVGTTSTITGTKFGATSTTTSGAGEFYVNSAGADAINAINIIKYSTTNTTAQQFIGFTINNANTGSGQINANGASQAAFGSFSDARLKENIVDLPSQLNNILALKPKEFDYIQSEGGGHQIGFVAQDMQTVYPDAISERADGMLVVTGWSKTEARLVKAIQEQQALIESLTTRLNALENK